MDEVLLKVRRVDDLAEVILAVGGGEGQRVVVGASTAGIIATAEAVVGGRGAVTVIGEAVEGHGDVRDNLTGLGLSGGDSTGNAEGNGSSLHRD